MQPVIKTVFPIFSDHGDIWWLNRLCQTTQSPKSPNQKGRTPGPQRHRCNVIIIIILTFNYLLPEKFYIGISFFFGYRFMLKNNIIFINFIIQNRISLLLSRQHCSFPLFFLIKVYYTTTSSGYSSEDLLSKPKKAILFLIRKSSHLCIARMLKLFVLL